ncbi:hypothetical protein C2845_PM02G18470 [Panicum miliaceum]|uniref:Uncharacterized protein n=1 Tax=Panicum miliaceum TaxID=4540 RepID=A0A3L6SG81_PANMI|nr:hypothetical protein C2845_PM02G18470 [Panicum miliaceum]
MGASPPPDLPPLARSSLPARSSPLASCATAPELPRPPSRGSPPSSCAAFGFAISPTEASRDGAGRRRTSTACDPRRTLTVVGPPHLSLNTHAPSYSLHDGRSLSAPDPPAHAGAHRAPCGACLMEVGAPSPGVGGWGIA